MVISLACFVINDALIKALGPSIPLWQTIFVRGVFCAVVIAIALKVSSIPVKPREHFRPPVIIRGLIDCLATFTYLLSLMHMPLGDAIAINMASPLLVTLLAVLAPVLLLVGLAILIVAAVILPKMVSVGSMLIF